MAKSGLYKRTFGYGTWEVRLDIDGNYPQNNASITLAAHNSHWVADADATGANNTWEGNHWYRNAGAANLSINGSKPDKFKIDWGQDAIGEYVNLYLYQGANEITTFYLDRESDHFREVEVELDYESGVNVAAAKSVNVGGTNHTLENIYEKAGCHVTVNASGNSVGSAAAGGDSRWSNAELADAMDTHWSKDDGTPWSMWVFFCKKETNPLVLGRMFDGSDQNQRQGTAIFVDAHDGVTREDEYLFQTVIHEVGHAFNLTHSWEKNFDPWHGGVVNEPRALSFMNYPWKYSDLVYGNTDAANFFDDFDYRFTDQEIEFLRHAPESFISMGQSAFGSDHSSIAADSQIPGEEAAAEGRCPVTLEVRVNKKKPVFQFLEPVSVELKLKNRGSEAITVEKGILDDLSRMSIWIRRNQGAPIRHAPYSKPCLKPETLELAPGASLYGSVFLSAGVNGWQIAEPGRYGISMALELGGGQIISSGELALMVLTPTQAIRKEEDRLAQDYFNNSVGRTLAAGGSKTQKKANDVLKDLSERFPDRAAARHAEVAVHMPAAGEYKMLALDAAGEAKIDLHKPDEAAAAAAKKALVDNAEAAAETLGHIAFKEKVDQLSEKAAARGDAATAKAAQLSLLETLEKRGVKLPAAVKAEIAKTVDGYKA
jgi:hypothetical protein